VRDATRVHVVKSCCMGTVCVGVVGTVAESVTFFTELVTSVAGLATSFAELAASVAGLVASAAGLVTSHAGLATSLAESNPVEAVGMP
jgi:hypothetical protein